MEWISVKEAMPPIGAAVLVKNREHKDTAFFITQKGGYYFCIGNDTKQSWEPTHWKELPESPEEK